MTRSGPLSAGERGDGTTWPIAPATGRRSGAPQSRDAAPGGRSRAGGRAQAQRGQMTGVPEHRRGGVPQQRMLAARREIRVGPVQLHTAPPPVRPVRHWPGPGQHPRPRRSGRPVLPAGRLSAPGPSPPARRAPAGNHHVPANPAAGRSAARSAASWAKSPPGAAQAPNPLPVQPCSSPRWPAAGPARPAWAARRAPARAAARLGQQVPHAAGALHRPGPRRPGRGPRQQPVRLGRARTRI